MTKAYVLLATTPDVIRKELTKWKRKGWVPVGKMKVDKALFKFKYYGELIVSTFAQEIVKDA